MNKQAFASPKRLYGPSRSLAMLHHIIGQQSGSLSLQATPEALTYSLTRAEQPPVHSVSESAAHVLSILSAWRVDPQERHRVFDDNTAQAVVALAHQLLEHVQNGTLNGNNSSYMLCIALLLRCAITPIGVYQRSDAGLRTGLRRVLGSAFAAETAAIAMAMSSYVTDPNAVLVYEEVVWCLSQQIYPAATLALARIVQGRDTQSLLFGEVVVLLWMLQTTHDHAWPDESLDLIKLGSNTIPQSLITRMIPPLPPQYSEGFIGAIGLFEPDPQLRSYENIPL